VAAQVKESDLRPGALLLDRTLGSCSADGETRTWLLLEREDIFFPVLMDCRSRWRCLRVIAWTDEHGTHCVRDEHSMADTVFLDGDRFELLQGADD